VPGARVAIPDTWWDACLPDPAGDEETRAIDRMMGEIGDLPDWALHVRADMPKWGFEMCAHRWLDGLDHVVVMIANGAHVASEAGHCGDVPAAVAQAAEARADAVQRWVDNDDAGGDPVARHTRDVLGDRDPAKVEAATCFAQLVRTGFFQWEKLDDVAAPWRERAADNSLLAAVFEGEGLDGHLHNDCGYKVIDRLDTFVRLIGRDTRGTDERHGACNSQLRFVFRDDPERYEVTRGVLWGLYAYLARHDAEWLRGAHPEVAGAGLVTLRRLTDAGDATPVRRWLAASLLKTTKLWCGRALGRCEPAQVPATATRLPGVPA